MLFSNLDIKKDNLYSKISQSFADKYYNDISSKGINSVVGLFHRDCLVVIENNKLYGGYNWLLNFTDSGVHKFIYQNISGTSQPINNNQILISVVGLVKGVSFWNRETEWMRFNEVFVLDNYAGNNFIIRNYMFRIVK